MDEPTDTRKLALRLLAVGTAFTYLNWSGLWGRLTAYPTIVGAIMLVCGVGALLHSKASNRSSRVLVPLYATIGILAGLAQLKWLGYFANGSNQFFIALNAVGVVALWVGVPIKMRAAERARHQGSNGGAAE